MYIFHSIICIFIYLGLFFKLSINKLYTLFGAVRYYTYIHLVIYFIVQFYSETNWCKWRDSSHATGSETANKLTIY